MTPLWVAFCAGFTVGVLGLVVVFSLTLRVVATLHELKAAEFYAAGDDLAVIRQKHAERLAARMARQEAEELSAAVRKGAV